MGTTKAECRSRLLVRQNHPTIDNPALAVSLLDKFESLWVAPRIDEVRLAARTTDGKTSLVAFLRGQADPSPCALNRTSQGFDHLFTLPSLPPSSALTADLLLALLASMSVSPVNPHAAAQRQPRPRADLRAGSWGGAPIAGTTTKNRFPPAPAGGAWGSGAQGGGWRALLPHRPAGGGGAYAWGGGGQALGGGAPPNA